jgi:hypothetical protein
LPHAPQFAASLASITQAPLHTVAPLGHDCPQTPTAHVALPPAGAWQAVHDDPHDVTAVSAAQLLPHRCVPLPQMQSPEALQTPLEGDEHAPDVRAEAEHTALPALHTTIPDWAQPPLPLDEHAPPNATQLPPHRLVPDGQTVPQSPPEQLCPDGHALPHAPQLEASLASSTHAPPQTVAPLGHDAPQTPSTQVALPLTGAPHAVHDEPHDVTAVSDTQLVPHRCVPLPQTQLPIALHTPLNGDEHAPAVRAEAEHTVLPALHASIPDWAQPPLPLDVHVPPSAAQLPPHRLVPDGQTVPQMPAEQL